METGQTCSILVLLAQPSPITVSSYASHGLQYTMTQEQSHKLLFLTLVTTYINSGPPNDEQITDVRSYREAEWIRWADLKL